MARNIVYDVKAFIPGDDSMKRLHYAGTFAAVLLAFATPAAGAPGDDTAADVLRDCGRSNLPRDEVSTCLERARLVDLSNPTPEIQSLVARLEQRARNEPEDGAMPPPPPPPPDRMDEDNQDRGGQGYDRDYGPDDEDMGPDDQGPPDDEDMSPDDQGPPDEDMGPDDEGPPSAAPPSDDDDVPPVDDSEDPPDPGYGPPDGSYDHSPPYGYEEESYPG